jgi:hypothetical protein
MFLLVNTELSKEDDDYRTSKRTTNVDREYSEERKTANLHHPIMNTFDQVEMNINIYDAITS